jgi:hypothetical protein
MPMLGAGDTAHRPSKKRPRARRPKGRRMTYAQHASQGRIRRRGGNWKSYYGARGQAGLHRQNRKRKKYSTSTSNAVKYPHLSSSKPGPGTGRSRTSSVASSYSVRKKNPPKPTPPRPKPVLKKPYRNPVRLDPLEHYSVTASLGSDVTFEGAQIYVDPGFDQDWFRNVDSNYSDPLNNGNSLQLGIGSDVTSLTQFTERYVETTPVYDAAINLPNTGNYVGIQVRIVEA